MVTKDLYSSYIIILIVEEIKEVFVEKGYSEIIRSLSEFLDKTFLETETILKQGKGIWDNITFPEKASEKDKLIDALEVAKKNTIEKFGGKENGI